MASIIGITVMWKEKDITVTLTHSDSLLFLDSQRAMVEVIQKGA